MSYISNGTIQEKRGLWRLSIIGDILTALFSAINVFFSSLWHTPQVRSQSSNTSYYQRNQQRRPNTSTSSSASGASKRANIRTFRNLGPANASCGGGG